MKTIAVKWLSAAAVLGLLSTACAGAPNARSAKDLQPDYFSGKLLLAQATSPPMDTGLTPGFQLLNAGNPGEAIPYFRQVLQSSPDQPAEVKAAQAGLRASYANFWPDGLVSLVSDNGGMERDEDHDGVADGWIFSADSETVEASITEGNKLQNGGFESVDAQLAPKGWMAFGTGLRASHPPVKVRHGWRSLQLAGEAGSGLYQTVDNLRVGQKYAFRCSTNMDSAPIALDSAGGTNPLAPGLIRTTDGPKPVGNGHWRQFEIRWTATAPSATVFVYASPAGLMESCRIGLEGAKTDWPLMTEARPRTGEFLEGKAAQAMDFSNVAGSGGAPVPYVHAYLSRTFQDCQPGTGYLARIPLFMKTDVSADVLNVRVGMDPRGGTDPKAPSVVWSGACSNRMFECDPSFPLQNATNKNNWRYFFVSAEAAGPAVTVYVETTARPKGWAGVEDMFVLADNVSLYSSDDPIVTDGYAIGSTGQDLPGIYGQFDARRCFAVAAMNAGPSSPKGTWAQLWQGASAYDTEDAATGDSILEGLSGVTALQPWVELTKAARLYKEEHFSVASQLSELADANPPVAMVSSEARLLLAHLRLAQNNAEAARPLLTEIINDSSVTDEVRATALLLRGKADVRDFERESAAGRLVASSAIQGSLNDFRAASHLSSPSAGFPYGEAVYNAAWSRYLAGDTQGARQEFAPLVAASSATGTYGAELFSLTIGQ